MMSPQTSCGLRMLAINCGPSLIVVSSPRTAHAHCEPFSRTEVLRDERRTRGRWGGSLRSWGDHERARRPEMGRIHRGGPLDPRARRHPLAARRCGPSRCSPGGSAGVDEGSTRAARPPGAARGPHAGWCGAAMDGRQEARPLRHPRSEPSRDLQATPRSRRAARADLHQARTDHLQRRGSVPGRVGGRVQEVSRPGSG